MWKSVLESNKKLYHLHIELTSKCNAACPHCPRHHRGVPVRNPAVGLYEISLENIKKWVPIDVIMKTGSMNICGNFGDPALCLDMVEIVEYFNTINPKIEIEIRTNGGARDTDFWKKLGELSKKSKKKIKTVFSIDGLEDTNHLYRRNVNWERLTENVLSYNNAGGYSYWEFLIFKHNEHQIEEAELMRQKLGVHTISFKKPIGFEDYANKRTIPIPVYDRKGKLDYILEPSDQFSNSKYPYVNNIKAVKKTIKIKTDMCELNPNEIDYSKYEDIENNEIKCKAVHDNGHIEVYIDSNGNVRPCCHIGVELDRHFQGDYGKQLGKIFKSDNLFNLKHNTLENILDLFDIRIKGTWDKSHEQGRCIKCSLQCGISSQVDSKRLYTHVTKKVNVEVPKPKTLI